MTPYEQFEVNREAAATYATSYAELRRLKGLGARGALSAENQYLLWIPRACIVGAMGSLDQYIHQVLYDQIPKILLDSSTHIADALAEQILRVATTRNAQSVRDNMHFIRSQHGPRDVATALKEQVMQFESYQAPDKIARAYRMLGHADIFQEVAEVWQGPNRDRQGISHRLDQYVKRRNQIAHEGDLTAENEPRPITPQYATDCLNFIWDLVWRLDGTIYGWDEEPPDARQGAAADV